MYPIDFFYRAAKLHPERIALQSSRVSITYRELVTRVTSLAAALQAIVLGGARRWMAVEAEGGGDG